MKQLLQNLQTGTTQIVDVPCPAAGQGELLIRTVCTVVSSGTERMLVEFGKAGWLEKARQQPDKVRMVLDKVRADGLAATIEAVQSKLDQPLAPGYCNAGVVVEVGRGVRGFAVGDRVMSNGGHAEMVCVPEHLCARIPDGVSDEEAAFSVLAAIGLQGIRLINPTLGEAVAVTGLGLIGLLTVQILRAHGCRVLGLDFDRARLALALQFGAEVVDLGGGADPLEQTAAFSRGRGMDAVIITASTESNEPVSLAARMCRQRGRIVLVGVAGLELSRADFYEKELSFQVSCSYGPGRYDPAYEEGGQDYPIGYVRWTEQRNFEAVLDLMAARKLDAKPLISHRFPLEQAVAAYDLLASDSPSLGIVLEYPGSTALDSHAQVRRTIPLAPGPATVGKVTVTCLGAGNYAGRVLIPAFREAGATLHTVVSARGVSALHYGRKHGFANVSTDEIGALADPAVDAVIVATRHDLHARQVLAALKSGKHVFCEKPLCLTLGELAQIEAELLLHPQVRLMVSFNRRFAPHIVRIRQLLVGVTEPKAFVMTVNAGAIPADHWTQDPAVGGGRILGEGCHFIDLLRHLAGAPIARFSAVAMGPHGVAARIPDRAVITLEFADGSIGTVHYLSNGDRRFPKERLEVFCAGRVLQLDNFRRMKGWGWPKANMNLWRQNKGQADCVRAFVTAVMSGGPSPIPADEIIEVSRVSIEAQRALM